MIDFTDITRSINESAEKEHGEAAAEKREVQIGKEIKKLCNAPDGSELGDIVTLAQELIDMHSK